MRADFRTLFDETNRNFVTGCLRQLHEFAGGREARRPAADDDDVELHCFAIDCFAIDCFAIDCFAIDCFAVDCFTLDRFTVTCFAVSRSHTHFLRYFVKPGQYKGKTLRAGAALTCVGAGKDNARPVVPHDASGPWLVRRAI